MGDDAACFLALTPKGRTVGIMSLSTSFDQPITKANFKTKTVNFLVKTQQQLEQQQQQRKQQQLQQQQLRRGPPSRHSGSTVATDKKVSPVRGILSWVTLEKCIKVKE